MGLIPSLSVQAVDRPDPDGDKWVPPKVAVTATGLTLIWVDGGDGGKLMAGGQDICGWRLEIVTGWDEVTEFKVVAKDGWLNGHFLGWIGIDDGVKTLKFG